MAITLDGRSESRRLLRRLKAHIKKRRFAIKLATILVGERYDSALYVRLKRKAAASIGIQTRFIPLPANITQGRLVSVIRGLNADRHVHGILLQLPLPKRLNADTIIQSIDPRKDVDGFHPGQRRVVPPPVAAVERLLDMANPRQRSRAVIIGRSSVFTEKLRDRLAARGWKTKLLSSRWATTTKQADVIITALGRGPQLRSSQVKRGVIVVDVGIRKHGKNTVGDVHPSVWKLAKAVSPVPGGVGPLTIYYVLRNTYQLIARP